MRNLLLSVALVLVPVGVFSVGYKALATGQAPLQAAAAELPSLGNMAPFETIIGDVQTLHAKGDLAAAQTRITDFETAWDQAQNSLRPINKGYWGNIDDAADAALGAMRAGTPDAASVTKTLADLMATLADPSLGAGATGAAVVVAGITTTDDTGRALPCEEMLKDVAAKLPKATLSDADHALALDYQTKALERCNADDDAHADAFSANALALLTASK